MSAAIFRENWATKLALAAVVLAVAASLLLAFLPFYQGVSVDAQTHETRAMSATLLEVNGKWVVILLAAPPVFAAAGLLAVRRMIPYSRTGRLPIWIPPTLLIIFVILSTFSIGAFYIPTSALMVVASIVAQRRTAKTSLVPLAR